MKPVLLLACGNPLRGDDGVAHELLRQFEAAGGPLLSNVEIEESHQLTPEMADSASRADRVIIVDAKCGPEPGAVSVQKVDPEIAEKVTGGLSHDFDPETLLNTTRSLFGTSPEVFVVTISADNFEHGDTLSGPVNAAIPRALDTVRELIAGTITTGSLKDA